MSRWQWSNQKDDRTRGAIIWYTLTTSDSSLPITQPGTRIPLTTRTIDCRLIVRVISSRHSLLELPLTRAHWEVFFQRSWILLTSNCTDRSFSYQSYFETSLNDQQRRVWGCFRTLMGYVTDYHLPHNRIIMHCLQSLILMASK